MSENKSEAKKSSKIETPKEDSKSRDVQKSNGEEKNYISFHPGEDIKSPKFEMNKTKTAKFREHEEEMS